MVRTLSTRYVLVPIAAGLLGALFLSGVYLGLVSLAESPQPALDLFWEDRLFVVPILAGFGVQAGLFTRLKLGNPGPVAAAGATTAAGGGRAAGGVARRRPPPGPRPPADPRLERRCGIPGAVESALPGRRSSDQPDRH